MTPQHIAADIELTVRFLSNIENLDPVPGERRDLDILLSEEGTRVIAAVWPDRSYDTELGLADQDQPQLLADYRGLVAERFGGFLETAARVCDRPLSHVMTHIEWSARLSSRELDRLLNGYDPLPFSVVVRLCNALQLEFSAGWFLEEPCRLSRRIDQSLLANQISDHLHNLTTEALENVRRKLPMGSKDADQVIEPDSYAAPRTRYRALYETLAGDTRATPRYSLSEIDQLLNSRGEPALPQSAHEHRSWWAGSGAKAEGRPQVRAWWAAGYRIREIDTDRETGMVSSIRFESLPGRADWIRDPERTDRGEYRMPEPVTVPIDERQPVDTVRAADARNSKGPDDTNIRTLREFLADQGEADRSQIEAMFRQYRKLDFEDTWMTNLLTRARRQGWTVRYGALSKPRWVAAGSKGDHMLWIASFLGFDWPEVGRDETVPNHFLVLVAEHMGLKLPPGSTQLEVAKAIIEAAGRRWEAGFVSEETATITLRGLEAVRIAVSAGTSGP